MWIPAVQHNLWSAVAIAQNSLSMLRKGRLDQHIGYQSSVEQLVNSHRREGAALQPMLDGSALVCLPAINGSFIATCKCILLAQETSVYMLHSKHAA